MESIVCANFLVLFYREITQAPNLFINMPNKYSLTAGLGPSRLSKRNQDDI